MSKVTFDYSKAAPFIKDHEVDSMKKLAEENYISLVVTHDYEFLNRTCDGYIQINNSLCIPEERC